MLRNPTNFPEYVHSEILHFYLLVSFGGDFDFQSQILSRVKQRFGLHCHLLRLKTVASSPSERAMQVLTDYFKARAYYSQSEIDLSSFVPDWISDDDIEKCNIFLREFATQSLIPYMERQMQIWNEQVANMRRGLTGRLFQAGKKYFGNTSSKGSSFHLMTLNYQNSQSAPKTINIYLAASSEMTMRRLADYAFFLQDYKYALIIYDLVKRDFQSDKAYRYYAGVQQMIGICSILCQEKKGAEGAFSAAINNFVDQKSVEDSLITGLKFHNAYLRVRSYNEAARIFIQLVPLFPEGLLGYIYEQIALCQANLPTPRKRKYKLYMYLAADKYYKIGLSRRGFSCLSCFDAKDISPWSLIFDSICLKKSEAYLSGRNLVAAFEWMLELLHSSKSSASSQEKYLRLLCEFHKQANFSDPIPLEAFEVAKIRLYRSSRDILSEKSDSISDKIFQNFQTPNVTISDNPAVSEWITVEAQIRNPLNCAVILNDVTINCTLDDDDGIGDAQKISPIAEIKLEASEWNTLKWTFKAEKKGVIKPFSLSFKLSEQIDVLKSLNESVTNTAECCCSVIEAMPHLSFEWVETPDTLIEGQMRQMQLTLKNFGNAPCSTISYQCSEIGYLSFHDENLYLTPEFEFKNWCKYDSSKQILLPNTLMPGDEVTIDAIIRGRSLGSRVLGIFFSYGSDLNKSIKRLVHNEIYLEVIPSLSVKLDLRSGRGNRASCEGSVILTNNSNLPIDIYEISSLGLRWSLQSNSPVVETRTLNQGQSTWISLALTPSSEDWDFLIEQWTSACIEKFIDSGNVNNEPVMQSLNLSSIYLTAEKKASVPIYNLIFEAHLLERLEKLQTKYPIIPLKIMKRIFSAYNSNSADILVNWMISGTVLSGSTYVTDMEVLKTKLDWVPSVDWKGQRTFLESTARKKQALIDCLLNPVRDINDCPVKAQLGVPKEIKLSYPTEYKCCIKITNNSWRAKFTYILQLRDDENLNVKPCFNWLGPSKLTGSLEPGETIDVPLNLYFPQTAVYDLDRWKILVYSEDLEYRGVDFPYISGGEQLVFAL